MGCSPGSALPACALQHGYWISRSDKYDQKEEILRPNFEMSWAKNKLWHNKALKAICEHAVGWAGNCIMTNDEFATYSDKQLRKQVETVFKGCACKWKKNNKEEPIQEKDSQEKQCESRKA